MTDLYCRVVSSDGQEQVFYVGDDSWERVLVRLKDARYPDRITVYCEKGGYIHTQTAVSGNGADFPEDEGLIFCPGFVIETQKCGERPCFKYPGVVFVLMEEV